jgi:ubiquinone biosynthesis protein UbiJ
MLLEAPFVAVLNHLLEKESWARDRLAAFHGKCVELRAPPLPPLRFAIEAQGLLTPGSQGSEPALLVTLRPDAPLAMLRGVEDFARSLDTTGDPGLAEVVMLLVRHLRWDVEEDLSRVIGDVAARRLAQGGRDFAAWQRDASQRIAESLADYLTEEKRLLVRRTELDPFSTAIGMLRDGVERLERRLADLG